MLIDPMYNAVSCPGANSLHTMACYQNLICPGLK